MITDNDIERLKKALENQETFLIPRGLSKDEMINFILQKANTEDANALTI